MLKMLTEKPVQNAQRIVHHVMILSASAAYKDFMKIKEAARNAVRTAESVMMQNHVRFVLMVSSFQS